MGERDRGRDRGRERQREREVQRKLEMQKKRIIKANKETNVTLADTISHTK